MAERESLRAAVRRHFNTITYDDEPWVGFRIGRLVVLLGKPYGTHNPVDNHVGWSPLSIRWELPWGPR